MNLDAKTTILGFAASRPDGTTCPSEIARVLAKENDTPLAWRDYMPIVHEAVDALNERGEITLTWKSAVMTERTGPYRIRVRR